MAVACLALFVALGGAGYAAFKLPKNSVKSKQIKNHAVKTVDLNQNAKAPLAGTADDANALGGIPAAGFQGFCQAGAIKGSVVVDTTGLPNDGDYQTVPGFNCADGGIVQIRKASAADGDYRVRFSPNPGTGSAIVSSQEYTRQVAASKRSDDPKAPGEDVFGVTVANSAGTPVNDGKFELVAF
jgi:hypothetical protein